MEGKNGQLSKLSHLWVVFDFKCAMRYKTRGQACWAFCCQGAKKLVLFRTPAMLGCLVW